MVTRSPATRRIGPRRWVTTRSPGMVEVGDRIAAIGYTDRDRVRVPDPDPGEAGATMREITKFAGVWRFDLEGGQTVYARDRDYIWLDIDMGAVGH